VTTKIIFWYPAPPGTAYAPGAFDSVVGKEAVIRFGKAEDPGRVTAAEVAPDGTGIRFTLEWLRECPPG
jgi:hypothetical protein